LRYGPGSMSLHIVSMRTTVVLSNVVKHQCLSTLYSADKCYKCLYRQTDEVHSYNPIPWREINHIYAHMISRSCHLQNAYHLVHGANNSYIVHVNVLHTADESSLTRIVIIFGLMSYDCHCLKYCAVYLLEHTTLF